MATPGFLKGRLESRDCTLNLKQLKIVILDEADQLFLEESSTNVDLNVIINNLFKTKLYIKPQYVLFSATVDERCEVNVARIITDPLPRAFKLATISIKLENVKQFKMALKSD